MANWDMTKVFCNGSHDVMNSIKDVFEDVEVCAFGSLCIRAKEGEVPAVLTELSKKYAGIHIISECCPVSDQYLYIYTHDHYNGVRTNTGLKLNYIINDFTAPTGLNDIEIIKQKAIELLSKYDLVISTNSGFWVDVNSEKEIKTEFMYKPFKIKASKVGQYININIYKPVISWRKCK